MCCNTQKPNLLQKLKIDVIVSPDTNKVQSENDNVYEECFGDRPILREDGHDAEY